MEQKQTLRDHLTAVRTGVSAAEFEASRALDPRQGSSWAIWGETTGDLSVFENSVTIAPHLRKDVVLIAANFGLSDDEGRFSSFQNFHARKHRGDTKLRKALTGTVLEGAFLTDIVKDHGTKYATRLGAEIRAGIIDTHTHVVSGFEAEQRALGLGPSTLYIPVGARTRELWDLLVRRGEIPATQRVFHREYGNGPQFTGKPVRNLAHYSAAVNMVDAVESLLAQPALN